MEVNENFPEDINDSLAELKPLHDVFTASQKVRENIGGEEEALKTLGEQPTLKDLANLLLTNLGGRIDHARADQGVLASNIAANTKTVELQGRQIKFLNKSQEELGRRIVDMNSVMEELNLERARQYRLTCELRQRGVKGNFTISGSDVPRFTRGENLFEIVGKLIWAKYQIEIDWWQMRALHRLPNNNVFLGLATRMPGSSYEKLIEACNKNPNPKLRVYLNQQLMEPYSSLHYAARKMKGAGAISYYRLDENGVTWISLKEGTNTFKFTSLKQLDTLGVEVPAELRDELRGSKERREKYEAESEMRNMERAREPRPAAPARETLPRNDTAGGSQSITLQHRATGGNKVPLGPRSSSAAGVAARQQFPPLLQQQQQRFVVPPPGRSPRPPAPATGYSFTVPSVNTTGTYMSTTGNGEDPNFGVF